MKPTLSVTLLGRGHSMNSARKQIKQIETELVRKYLLGGQGLTTDDALKELKIKDIYTPILRIRESIPVEETKVMRSHLGSGNVRKLKYYFIDTYVIALYKTTRGRDSLKQQQIAARIAKARAKDNKVLKRMCEYSKPETMMLKLHEIYGQQAANDD